MQQGISNEEMRLGLTSPHLKPARSLQNRRKKYDVPGNSLFFRALLFFRRRTLNKIDRWSKSFGGFAPSVWLQRARRSRPWGAPARREAVRPGQRVEKPGVDSTAGFTALGRARCEPVRRRASPGRRWRDRSTSPQMSLPTLPFRNTRGSASCVPGSAVQHTLRRRLAPGRAVESR